MLNKDFKKGTGQQLDPYFNLKFYEICAIDMINANVIPD